jgi:hypothetical protein
VNSAKAAGSISGCRAVIDAAAVGRGLEVLLDVEIFAQDRRTVEEFEETVAAYEAFLMGRLSGLPAVSRLESHLTMKQIKAPT